MEKFEIACYDNYEKEVNRELITAATEDDAFVNFYNKNRELRYSRNYYKFVDKANQEKFIEWERNLSEKRSFDLYYGGGIVD
jgi:hypothetical protein